MNSQTLREDTARIAEQAAEWIEQVTAQPQRRAAFFDWLRASPRHMEETLFVLALLRETATLDEALARTVLTEIRDPGVTPGARIVSLETEPSTSVEPPAARFQPRRKWAGALAACLALALGAGWWLAQPRAQEFSTRIGEQRSFTLEDGSLVRLNTRTRLEVRFTERERRLRLLEGEALFDVRHDAARPFTVTTADTVVEALGTQFNVYRRPDGTQVAVLAGLVRVADSRVPAGEQVEVVQGRINKHEALDLARVTAWQQRRLVFENDTLYEIAAQFNRYNTQLSIHIEPGLESQRFTGAFHADLPEAFVSALAANRRLQIERRDGRIIVRPR